MLIAQLFEALSPIIVAYADADLASGDNQKPDDDFEDHRVTGGRRITMGMLANVVRTMNAVAIFNKTTPKETPKSLSFNDVNDYVHQSEQQFEHLQWLCLGLATELEKVQKITSGLADRTAAQSELLSKKAEAKTLNQQCIDAVNVLAKASLDKMPFGYDIELNFNTVECSISMTDPHSNPVDDDGRDNSESSFLYYVELANELDKSQRELEKLP